MGGATVDAPVVEVLSDAVNRAVVRMPGRRFPDLVIQGDSLIRLTAQVREIAERAERSGDADLGRLAGNLHVELEELLTHYSRVCKAAPPQ